MLYAHNIDTFHPCPVCGFMYSGKHGPDRRTEIRTPEKISFALFWQGRFFKASTFDSSEKGVGIRVLGSPTLAKGDVLTLPIANPPINAKVMWVKKTSHESMAGLQKITQPSQTLR
jgi:hypothetical protein